MKIQIMKKIFVIFVTEALTLNFLVSANSTVAPSNNSIAVPVPNAEKNTTNIPNADTGGNVSVPPGTGNNNTGVEPTVNVYCHNESMVICLKPHANVSLTGSWKMYADGSEQSQCVGSNNSLPKECASDTYALTLPLTDVQLDICGTIRNEDPRFSHFWNRIVVASTNESIPQYNFNVYCSYQRLAVGKFTGIGIVSNTGDNQGTKVNANLSLSLVNLNGKSIQAGASVVVGDMIRFHIRLVRDGNYHSFQVLTCTASSSFMMPDVHSVTRTLMTNGCPNGNGPGMNSWYWLATENTNTTYTMESGNVSMFRLSSSDTVYIYCTIKLCLLSGDVDCAPKTQESCANISSTVRKKRAANEFISTTLSTDILVVDPSKSSNGLESGSSSPSALLIVFGILAAVILIAVVLGAAFLLNSRKNAQGHPERFALPRLRNTHQRF